MDLLNSISSDGGGVPWNDGQKPGIILSMEKIQNRTKSLYLQDNYSL